MLIFIPSLAYRGISPPQPVETTADSSRVPGVGNDSLSVAEELLPPVWRDKLGEREREREVKCVCVCVRKGEVCVWGYRCFYLSTSFMINRRTDTT